MREGTIDGTALPRLARLWLLIGMVSGVAVTHSTSFIPAKEHVRAHEHAITHGTRVLMAINADCNTARRLGTAIADTWAKDVPSYVTPRIFIGGSARAGRFTNCTGNPALERALVTYLPWCPDTYPPVEKVLCMWTYIRNTWRDAYTHFAKVDADTHVNVANLAVLLSSLAPALPLMAGAVGAGRGADLGHVDPFCMGPAYIVTRSLLHALPSSLTAGMRDPEIPPNSDRAFSYIVKKHTNVSCMQDVQTKFKWSFMNRYWDISPDNGSLVAPVFRKNAQMHLPILHPLYSSFVRAVSVHPFKTGSDMHRFHAALRDGRLPLFRIPFPPPKKTVDVLRPMCVFNPARQYELNGLDLRECDALTPSFKSRAINAVTAHIIHLPERALSSLKANNISSVLRAAGIHVVQVKGFDGPLLLGKWLADKTLGAPSKQTLRAPEIGVRASFTTALTRIVASETMRAPSAYTSQTNELANIHIFLEDDVILAPNFDVKLDTLLTTNRRCGSFLSMAPGGVLLLGGTVWRDGTYPRVSKWSSGWTQIDKERDALLSSEDKACYNVANGTYGAFAWVATTNAAQAMLAWLNRAENIQRPVDHAWPFLADAGFVVRALDPPLAIVDLKDPIIHTSVKHTNVSLRYRVHRWTKFA